MQEEDLVQVVELIEERQEIEKEIAELEKEIYGFDLSLLEPPNTEQN